MTAVEPSANGFGRAPCVGTEEMTSGDDMSEWFRCVKCGAPATLLTQECIYDTLGWGVWFKWECELCGIRTILLRNPNT